MSFSNKQVPKNFPQVKGLLHPEFHLLFMHSLFLKTYYCTGSYITQKILFNIPNFQKRKGKPKNLRLFSQFPNIVGAFPKIFNFLDIPNAKKLG